MTSPPVLALPAGRRHESLEVGAAPVVRRFLERLDLPGLFDRHLPRLPGRQPELPTSTVLCVLLSNLLLARAPLYGIAAWAAYHQRRTPADESPDRFTKLIAPGRQGVHNAARVAQPPLDNPAGFQAPQSVSQQIGGYPTERRHEFAVAHRAGKKLADDEQAPAITHHVKRTGQTAKLPVRTRCCSLDFIHKT